MSCQIKTCGRFVDSEKIRTNLNCNQPNPFIPWLALCRISASPTGDVIAFSYRANVAIATSKWESSTNSLLFSQASHERDLIPGDDITSVLCLPIVGQSQSSQTGPDWTCVVLGFKSGKVRYYTEYLSLLFEEQYHENSVTNIKCQSQHSPRPDLSSELKPEEVYIVYESVVCILAGTQLFTALRNCRNQLAKDRANCTTYNPPSPTPSLTTPPRKWVLTDQPLIYDSTVAGLQLSNTFDHLMTASTCGGFSSRYRAMPPNNTLVMGVGAKPFVGFHYALEGGAAQPVLQDVARAVAAKVKSALPGWLTGRSQTAEAPPSLASQTAEDTACRFGICDLRRKGYAIILSPNRRYAAINDDLGRISIINIQRGVVVRLIKGYRDTEMAFAQVRDDVRSKHKKRTKIGLFLILYCRKRGCIDIYNLMQGVKVVSYSATDRSRLLYMDYGLMGFQSTSKTKYICQYTTVLIDPDGTLKEIVIPFHFALPEKNCARAKDIHLCKRLKQFLKSDNDNAAEECLQTCSQVSMEPLQVQCMEVIASSRNITADIIKSCAKLYFDVYEATPCQDLDMHKVNLANYCKFLGKLCDLYSFIANHTADAENANVPQLQTNLCLAQKQMDNLQKLLDLSAPKAALEYKLPLRVKFTDQVSNFTISEFISCFEALEKAQIVLKKLDEEQTFRCAEFIFQNYVTYKISNCSVYEDFTDKVLQTNIDKTDFFKLLLNFWVNRELNIKVNLENEIYNLSQICYQFSKSIDVQQVVGEYNSISPFWEDIRDILAKSARPFPSLMAAIICKSTAHKIEMERDASQAEGEDIEIWEKLTQENCQWALLIGKLEDVCLLNIILEHRIPTSDNPLPKLHHDKTDISLNYILDGGRGAVTELVARWLTRSGVNPETLSADFEEFKLLKKQFPHSLETSVLLVNMCWEYCLAWKQNITEINLLEAALSCLKHAKDVHMKNGISCMLWSTHLKILFENTCKLINKVGKLPKERLCRQDTGFSDYQITLFVEVCADFINEFIDNMAVSVSTPKIGLQFEQIWEQDNNKQSLAELALNQSQISYDLLLLHYQLTLVVQMVTKFGVKHAKLLNNLFDPSVASAFFLDFQQSVNINTIKCESKVQTSRIQFLSKVINASVETVTLNDGQIFSADHVKWMACCMNLGRFWNIDVDILRRYQVAKLYLNGFDSLAEEITVTCSDQGKLAPDLVVVAGKRLAKLLSSSEDLGEKIAAFSPALTSYLDTLNGDWCSPSSLDRTTALIASCVQYLPEDQSESKLAQLMYDACSALKDLE